MGKAFAFVNKELVAQDLKSLDPTRHHIFCLLGDSPQLEEFSLPQLPLPPRPSLLIATCDKELYYEKRDSVNLLFFDPAGAGTTLSVQLRTGSLEVSRHEVVLGARGEGALSVGLLPVGDYLVYARGEQLCSFTVAAYSLAPLVGTLLRLEKETNDLVRATLNVATYGRPLEGAIWVTLRPARGRQRRVFAMVKDGVLEARLELNEAGPYYIDLQHAEQTDLTATVPLPGSSRSERTGLPMSGFAPQWTASMLPSSESEEVRGLYLTSTPNPNSPFRFERVDGKTARLTALSVDAPITVAVLDPVGQTAPKVYQWDKLEACEEVEFDLPSPMGVVAVGTYYRDEPWEGWAMTLAPSELTCSINPPETLQAGESARIEVEASSDCALYLLVKDARLACREKPGDRLASRLLDEVRNLRVLSRTGRVWGRRFETNHQPRLEQFMDVLELEETLRERARRTVRWAGCSAEQALSGVLGISEREVLGRVYDFDMADISEVDPELVRAIPEHLAQRYKCLPIKQIDAKTLVLAMVDPLNVIAIDDIGLITGFKVEPVLIEEAPLVRLLNMQYGVTDLVEVEETVKDISAQDFGSFDFDDDMDEEIALDKLKTWGDSVYEREVASAPEPEEPAENENAEVFHAGWLQVKDGKATIEIQTPAQPTEIVVEVFCANGLDWSVDKAQFKTEKQLILSLDCPPFVHPQDEVEGRLVVFAGQPPFRVSVCRDGKPLDVPEVVESRKPVSFACVPGDYLAVVEEITTGRIEKISARVEQAGRVSGIRRTVTWLRTGDKLCRKMEPSIFELRALDGVERPAQRLGQATADYSHLCCEQTAAKILAACYLWLSSPSDHLESVVRAGIEREKQMFLPGRGLAIYPGYTEPAPYWGPIAAQHLCQLELLSGHPMSESFGKLIEEGLSIGRQSMEAFGQSWPPTSREGAHNCYLEYRFGEADPALVARAKNGFEPDGWGRVGERRARCYQAAILLRSGESTDLAVKLVNEVLQGIRDTGGLYSTVDSTAALALFSELREFGPEWSQPALEYDGEEIMSVHAKEGDALVEVTRAFCEDWSQLKTTTEVEAALKPSTLDAGKVTQLEVSIPDGYRDGDLVWVCLPRALARLQGGGQVRQFSVDFEGKTRVSLELVALAPTKGRGETVLVCLRNMFLEERVALADPLRVQVQAPSLSRSAGLEAPAAFLGADLTLDGLRGTPESLGQIQTLSGLIHHPDVVGCLEQFVRRAGKENCQSIIFDWADEGLARCRFMTASGVKEAGRYPAPLQAALVGRLQMLSKNALGQSGPQEGEVQIGELTLPVDILPTSLGMMATLVLKDRSADGMSWILALSGVQQALVNDQAPDLESLRAARPQGKSPGVEELMQLLTRDPIPKEEALVILADLAGEFQGLLASEVEVRGRKRTGG